MICFCLDLPFHLLSLVACHSALGSLSPFCLEYFPLGHEHLAFHNWGLSSLLLAWSPNLYWLLTSCISLYITASSFTFFIVLILTKFVSFTCLTVSPINAAPWAYLICSLLICSWLYFQPLEQCLVHKRYSVALCGRRFIFFWNRKKDFCSLSLKCIY